ncbi:MAG TPA: universal stress protein, partial [Pyrinomonadaceae bacterium]|nr:universal stress protein [Pyrinomonadaceae bacterium]
MKEKVLIAYDGSECADAALDDLQQAGLPDEVDALVMTVAEIWLPPPPPSSYEILEEARQVHVPADLLKVYAKDSPAMKEAEGLAERARLRLRSKFPQWQVRAEATYGSPAWELIMKADQWKPRLIVVGSHGRTALGRFILGSVSQKVVTESHCSVRVARGRVEEPGTPLRLVIGVDGSQGAEAALGEVAARHWPEGSAARVIVVEDPLVPTALGRIIPPVANWVKENNREEGVWAQAIAEQGARALT